MRKNKPWRSWAQCLAEKEARELIVHDRMKKRTKEVYRLYKRSGTLKKTGEILGLTRERVRQLLEYGHCTKTIVYLGADTRRVIALFEKIDRTELIRDLETALPQAEICSKYGISVALCQKLQECVAKGWDLAEV